MSTPKKKIYDGKQWKALRLQVLQDEPVCHWCKKAPATEADHLIELDRGGDAYDRANLVGSCRPCNATRGNRYRQAKEAGKARAGVARAVQQAVPAFLDVEVPRPRAPRGVSPQDSPELGGSGTDQDYRRLSGRNEPRLVSPVVGATGTRGADLAQWAKGVAGVELMAWQRQVLDDMLSVKADGMVFREALVSTARQQGKSVALRMLAGWWITAEALRRGSPQKALLVSNKLDRTMPMFRELAELLEVKLGAKVRWANGSAGITMPDGSTLGMAAAKDNHHGGTYDLILVDEVWDIAPSVINDALRPSMIARPNPLLAMWSTAGDQSSALMLGLREKAITALDDGRATNLYFAEWSPPAGVDPDDRQWWTWANPALGTTVTWDALEAAADGGDRAAFLRAHLNLWITSAQSWLPIGAWEKQQTDEPMPAGGVLAIDTSMDESRYVGVRAMSTEHGVQACVEFIVDSEAACWREVDRVLEDTTVQLRVTPGLDLHTPPALRRRAETRGYRELLLHTPIVRAMITEGRVWHNGQRILAEHVTRAVAVKSQNSIAIASSKSPGPVELCRCLIWAAADASKPRAAGKPAFAASR